MGTEPRGPKFTIDYNCFFDFFKSFPWERVMKIQLQYIYVVWIIIVLWRYILQMKGPGWLNELGSWITWQLIQAYHQYGVGSRPAL